MWPLGHAAVAYLCSRPLADARETDAPGDLAVIAVLLGSQLPDLVDKPLAWYLDVLPAGRTLAHSLLVLVPFCAVVFALARRSGRRELGVAVAVGALSHALVDGLPVLWDPDAGVGFLLWPAFEVTGYEGGAPTIFGLLRESVGDPFFLAEFALAAIALVVWNRDGRPGLAPVRAVLARGRARLERIDA